MLLEVKELYVAPTLRIHLMIDDPSGQSIIAKPRHLVPLSGVMWPDAIKEDIVRQFKNIGVEDPLQQKLVEPFALAFGGKNENGKFIADDVDWGLVIDYFRWEASAWAADSDEEIQEHDSLVAEFREKHGSIINHRLVYSDRKGLD